ncbi:MAG: MraY family glycosyltransferase [Crocinitomicaceae bacterium]
MKLDLTHILLLLLGSFFLTYFLIPKIISVARYKRLMDSPNERSSHKRSTPNLGGIAFYITIMLSFYFLDHVDRYNTIPSMLPGITILFIMGLKDDLTVLSARTKFGSQIIASLFLVVHYKFEIYGLNGFMGIQSINPYLAAFLALFLMIAIINAFNLIDGIDGLASIIGLIIFVLYSILFFLTHSYFIFGLCMVMIGSLAAFLRYNFSNRMKIFMGDTGSMLVGFIIAAMSIRLLSLPKQEILHLPFRAENVPFVAAAILIVPLYDMTRVFIIRLLNKKGPFHPDRNHIHHLLIDQFHFSHAKASIMLGVFNVLFLLFFHYLSIHFSVYVLTGVFLTTLALMSWLLHVLKRTQRFKLQENNG